MGRVACFFALSTLGCATFRPPLACPDGTCPAWLEIKSSHFALQTDLPEEDARERIAQFEQSYQALNQFAFPSNDPPRGQTTVVIFSRREDYEEIAPPHSMGFFRTFDIDQKPLIVMQGPSSDRTREILQHELTHRFVRHFAPRAPLWLNEGLAGFYETLQIKDSEMVIGKPSSRYRFESGGLMKGSHLGWIRVELPSAAELLGASPEVFRDPGRVDSFYAASWLFVSMLVHGPPRYATRFWSFVNALPNGRKAENAWRESFGAISEDELNQALLEYAQKGEIVVERVRFEALPDSSPILGTMNRDEIRTLWAQLRLLAGQEQAEIGQQELFNVLQQSPSYAEAYHWGGLIALTRGRLSDAEAYFREALKLSPREERYLLGLCGAIRAQELARPPEERDPARLKELMIQLRKLATSPAALNALGWYYAELGQPDEGWVFAEKAVQMEPSCARCLDTLAWLAFKKGRPRKARELELEALSIVPESIPVEGWLDRLRQYERAIQASEQRSAGD